MVTAGETNGVLPFASHPSEQELVAAFLRPRVVSGDNSACGFIHDADVYSAHPAQLTGEHAPALAGDGEEVWYFFTAPRAKGAGVRKVRTVDTGEGCWHSEAGVKPVVDARRRRCDGHRQVFSFVTKEGGRRVRSGWLMVALGLDDDGHDKLTLCKVYFSPRARKNTPEQPAASTALSGRKRKAAGSTPATPGRRRRVCMMSHGEADDDDDDETAGRTPNGAVREERQAAAAVDGEVDDPTTFSSLLWNTAMDGPLWNFFCNEEVTMTELLTMSDEQFDRDHPPPPATAMESNHANLPLTPAPEY